ncbi:hypothetical protein SARC_06678 [Sphaeroforma arctica JP610]|uniref:CSD domain-containing protein n=1 Tax=Sphaeroforma arctica JP610 TaxID=667725 RepID=A0A0L0FWP7_9EUKA|nr:hypothetical protein SARC_06678 [Sphaeroforma arctica JP610]KNC80986.1 hypothetical protein SARC_06678 [Sphaeroforma arctica JP610]|eukprot:XP_014154888.1 hypothetical protein SARC_06678 [Sphaeroforma arctica JP610]
MSQYNPPRGPGGLTEGQSYDDRGRRSPNRRRPNSGRSSRSGRDGRDHNNGGNNGMGSDMNSGMNNGMNDRYSNDRRGDRRDNHRDSSRGMQAPARYDTSAQSQTETGFVEKMCDAYGFIDCDIRRQKLFFHYSHCELIDDLVVGDYVSFAVVMDTQTRKNVGFEIKRLPVTVPDSVEWDETTKFSKPITGTIYRKARGRVGSEYESPGWIVYEMDGHSYRVAYLPSELSSGRQLGGQSHFGSQPPTYAIGDKVTMCLGPEDGGRRLAHNIVLCSPIDDSPALERGLGVVTSLKDGYGFLKRDPKFGTGDIFFHYSGVVGMNPTELQEGDNVEYSETNKQDKLRAVDVVYVAPEDMEVISEEIFTGKVDRAVQKPGQRDSDRDRPYRERDRDGDRDRESKGIIMHVVKREAGAHDTTDTLENGATDKDGARAEMNEAEGETAKDNSYIDTPQNSAEHVHYSAENGTNEAETVAEESVGDMGDHAEGTEQTASAKRSRRNRRGTRKEMLTFRVADQVDAEETFGKNDEVTFMKCTHRRTQMSRAVGVALVARAPEVVEYGFVSGLNKSFGFIERSAKLACLFFHFNDIEHEDGESALVVGGPVKFVVVPDKKGKPCANKVQPISAEEMPPLTISYKDDQPLFGRVHRVFAAVAFPAERYGGMVAYEGPQMEVHRCPFGIVGLPSAGTRAPLLVGESVCFRRGVRGGVSRGRGDGKPKWEAMEVCALYAQSDLKHTDKRRGRVVGVTDQGGEIEHDGKNVPYYLCEVLEGSVMVEGEEVEFNLAENCITKTLNCCRITRSRLRPRKIIGLAALTFGPIRQPYLPHKTSNGFANRTGAKEEPKQVLGDETSAEGGVSENGVTEVGLANE